MKLNELERAMLAGEHGGAVRAAIEHQIKVGDFFGAEDFVPVTRAHIMADSESLGEAGVRWLESLDSGPLARVSEDDRWWSPLAARLGALVLASGLPRGGWLEQVSVLRIVQ